MFSPESFARAGNTGKPYWLDETAGAAAVTTQLTNALLAIAHSPLACEYEISPPSPDWLIDPTQVSLYYQPQLGDLQEIPKVSNLGTCAKSPNGGWYFDDPAAPRKISACPCSCANFDAGQVRVVYGCRPPIYIDD